MGNYKFKLSCMIPNAWYKLKDMSKIRTHHKNIPKYIPPFSQSAPNNLSRIQVQPHLSNQRKSYYITRDLIKIHSNPPIQTKIYNKNSIYSPRKSSPRKRKSVKRRVSNRLVTSVPTSDNCQTTLKSRTKSKLDNQTSEYKPILPESPNPLKLPETFDGMISWSTSCPCRIQNDIIYDKTFSESNNLPPIITKKHGSENISRTKKRFSTNSLSPCAKIRTNSPKAVNRRIQCGKKSLYWCSGRENLAVVKMSNDPRNDFMDSMVEMIVENNITAAKELEELLVCYLLLNSNEYHDIIIKVFKQIWSNFVSVQLE